MTDFDKLEMIVEMPLVIRFGMSEDDPYVRGQLDFKNRIRRYLADPEIPELIDG